MSTSFNKFSGFRRIRKLAVAEKNPDEPKPVDELAEAQAQVIRVPEDGESTVLQPRNDPQKTEDCGEGQPRLLFGHRLPSASAEPLTDEDQWASMDYNKILGPAIGSTPASTKDGAQLHKFSTNYFDTLGASSHISGRLGDAGHDSLKLRSNFRQNFEKKPFHARQDILEELPGPRQDQPQQVPQETNVFGTLRLQTGRNPLRQRHPGLRPTRRRSRSPRLERRPSPERDLGLGNWLAIPNENSRRSRGQSAGSITDDEDQPTNPIRPAVRPPPLRSGLQALDFALAHKGRLAPQ